jgi:L-rhamnose mutarotase
VFLRAFFAVSVLKNLTTKGTEESQRALSINDLDIIPMQRVAFKMKLFPGCVDEYKLRHDEIWPGISNLLKESGISEYSIFFDDETNYLFAFMKADDEKKLDQLPYNSIMQQWWQYMSDIMETNPDNSPVSNTFKEVFYLA